MKQVFILAYVENIYVLILEKLCPLNIKIGIQGPSMSNCINNTKKSWKKLEYI